jgi:hypothetical protein
MLYELGRRRNIRIRLDRYANAQTAAAVYNTLRKKDEDPVATGMDFVRTPEQQAKRDRMLEAKGFIRSAIMGVPRMAPRGAYLKARKNVIGKLLSAGHADAERLFDEMCPHLRPTEEEKNG